MSTSFEKALDLAFLALFQCSACNQGRAPRLQTFPFCANCAERPAPAPELCPLCASPVCPQLRSSVPPTAPPLFEPNPEPCSRPFHASPHAIATYFARYLMTPSRSALLKSWKKKPQWIHTRALLHWREPIAQATLARLTARKYDGIIPIPQSIERSYRLGRSPALSLADWISESLPGNPPVLQALEMRFLGLGRKPPLRQAERRREERFAQSPDRFEVSGISAFARGYRRNSGRFLLVDDFMTTGHTLRQAALALKRGHAHFGAFSDFREIDAFCLAVRPPRLEGN